MRYSVQKKHGVSLILFMKGVFAMSEKKHQVTSLYEGIPAVAELNRVQGFDPRKLLRRTVSRTGKEEVLKLDLRYKKLWFRLAYPNGRLKLNALRITEQLAIFEARVYMDRSDAEPIGNFTAACTCEEIPDGHYVKAAQEAALDEALTNSGFGLQFADVCVGKNEERYGSEIPLADGQIAGKDSNVVKPGTDGRQRSGTSQQTAKVTETPLQIADNTEIPKQTVNTATVTQQIPNTGESPQRSAEITKIPVQAEERTVITQPSLVQVAKVQESPSIPDAEKRTVTTPAADTLPQKEHSDTSGEMDQLPTELMEAAADDKAESMKTDTFSPNCGVGSGRVIQETEQSQVSYTADMPVAEIIKRMTFEEAQRVTVDEGTCSGWTMAEVAERRPPSLKWYVYGYKKNNNILRAAAQIMWDSLNGQKAG